MHRTLSIGLYSRIRYLSSTNDFLVWSSNLVLSFPTTFLAESLASTNKTLWSIPSGYSKKTRARTYSYAAPVIPISCLGKDPLNRSPNLMGRTSAWWTKEPHLVRRTACRRCTHCRQRCQASGIEPSILLRNQSFSFHWALLSWVLLDLPFFRSYLRHCPMWFVSYWLGNPPPTPFAVHCSQGNCL